MLSLQKNAKIRVINEQDHKTSLRSIGEIIGDHKFIRESVYDWFGNQHMIHIEPAPEKEKAYKLFGMTGEPIFVGESHQVLCRRDSKARYELVPVKDIREPVFVRLPQRKTQCDNDLPFNTLGMDSAGIYLQPDPRDLGAAMECAATAGLSVRRRKTELRLDLDVNRPPCFATKLINDNFNENLEVTLETLCSGAVVMPHILFSDEYVEIVKKTGVIFEGSSLYNDLLIGVPRLVDRDFSVYHIHRDGAPVELPWFTT